MQKFDRNIGFWRKAPIFGEKIGEIRGHNIDPSITITDRLSQRGFSVVKGDPDLGKFFF
jgi:hypothetical protein